MEHHPPDAPHPDRRLTFLLPGRDRPGAAGGSSFGHVRTWAGILLAGGLLAAACTRPGEDVAPPVPEPIVFPTTVAPTSTAVVTTSPTTTPATTSPPTSAPSTTAPATTVPPTTASPTTAPATTVPATTVPPTTVPPVAPVLWSAPLDLTQPLFAFGSSVEGRALVAERYGALGGRRVLVIGVIHGNEDAGVGVIDALRATPPPPGVELWLVESMNPDGQAIGDRHNAHHVDLNRNFPYNWGPIGEPGAGQYAGPGPASEPETLAVINLITQLRPDITIWYHQDLFTISPSTGRDGRIRARYSELTGVPIGEITGGTYTGVAATWARHQVAPDDGVAFIVELGATLSPDEAAVHADAVLTVATED